MVKTPTFKIQIGGKIVENSQVIQLDYSDDIDDEMDTVNIIFTSSILFEKPKNPIAYNIAPIEIINPIEIEVGHKENGLWSIGKFYILKKHFNLVNKTLTVSASSIDFLSPIKGRRDFSYEKMSLEQILSIIAKRHNLKVKNEIKDAYFEHESQNNETDIAFLQRLAKELGATFAIKNDTIIFTSKELEDEEVTLIEVDVKDIENGYIEIINKTIYHSAIVEWRDTKKNKVERVRVYRKRKRRKREKTKDSKTTIRRRKTRTKRKAKTLVNVRKKYKIKTVTLKKDITVGDGEPILRIRRFFKNAIQARRVAKAELEKANRKTLRGSFDIEGSNIIAGAKLEFLDIDKDFDSTFTVKSVSHTISNAGFKTHVEIEN